MPFEFRSFYLFIVPALDGLTSNTFIVRKTQLPISLPISSHCLVSQPRISEGPAPLIVMPYAPELLANFTNPVELRK